MADEKDVDSGKRSYARGNTGEDGSYNIGKNRPPEDGQFRAGDGRPRGRRAKGQRNFDTEFDEESRRRMTIRENGKERRVTKLRGTIIRTFDSALAKGDSRSQNLVFSHAARISDKRASPAVHSSPDDEQLNTWLRDRLAVIEGSELRATDQSIEASRSSPGEEAGDGQ